MSDFINFICDYWYILILAIAVITVGFVMVYNFVKLPKSEQIKKLQEWLLYAVIEAEKELGSGTGQIKLRMVYDMFIGKFPTLAKMFTFNAFAAFVDIALGKMEDLLKQNESLAEYVGREGVISDVENK